MATENTEKGFWHDYVVMYGLFPHQPDSLAITGNLAKPRPI